MSNTSIKTGKAPAPVGHYPHARRAGNLLFLSGIGPRQPGSDEIPGLQYDDAGNIVGYDIAAQCRAVFDNVRNVLEAAGSSWDKLLDVTVFLTDIEADFAIYNNLWAEYFADHPPCRTTVEISRLPTPIAIELKCIAAV